MPLVLVEHEEGGPAEVSLQTLAFARSLVAEAPLHALLLGPGGTEAAARLGAHEIGRASCRERV